LAAPSTIQGLEFGGLDLPVSIGEFVFYVVFVLQGERMLGIMSRFIKARAQKGNLSVKILHISSIWFSSFSLS